MIKEEKILEIKSVNINSFQLSNELWKTINWISQYYICSLGRTLHATIPYQHIKNLNLNSVKKVEITNLGKNAVSNNLIKYPNQKKILIFLNLNNDILFSQLKNICISFRSTCKRLESLKFIKILQIDEQYVEDIKQTNKYNLTKDQGSIAKKISKEWNSNKKPVLLSGVSGSGKTMVYIDLIKSAILKALRTISVIFSDASTAWAHLLIGLHIPMASMIWWLSLCCRLVEPCPMIATTGARSMFASAIPVRRLVTPGPRVPRQTPAFPVSLPWASAAKAAPCS